jgi:hypothetical protein
MKRLKWILTTKLTGYYAELSAVCDTADNVDQQYLLPRIWIPIRRLLHLMVVGGYDMGGVILDNDGAFDF